MKYEVEIQIHAYDDDGNYVGEVVSKNAPIQNISKSQIIDMLDDAKHKVIQSK